MKMDYRDLGLSPQESYVIGLSSGDYDGFKYQQKEISKIIKVHPNKVKHIEKRALAKSSNTSQNNS